MKLNEKGIHFRWLVPKGILINWNARRYSLDSIHKAKEFYDRHANVSEEESERPEKDRGKSREQDIETLGVTSSSKGEEDKEEGSV